MSVYIELRTTPEAIRALSIEEIAGLEQLDYGISDGAYVLARGETGKYNILFSAKRIGRGFEVSLEERKVSISLPLPNTPHDIDLCYRLTARLCRRLGLDSFNRDGEDIPLAEAASLVTIDLQASLNAIRNMAHEIGEGKSQSISVFGALYPIVIGPQELEYIGGTLDGFEALLDRLQQMDAWYAVPRFFRLESDEAGKDGPVVGMFFIGEDLPVILPRDPAPAYQKVEGIAGYYVRIPDQNDIPYADFWSHVDHVEHYDAEHDILCLSKEVILHLAEQHTVNMLTGEHVRGHYWGKRYDTGRTHLRKIRDLSLPLPEQAAWNHLAVFLRWAFEHDLLSDALLAELPALPRIISEHTYDLRELIAGGTAFNGALQTLHFNAQGRAFADAFYRFGEDGFPACIDRFAEEVLGSEKYHCDEYHNEAYLFVPWNEDYYTGLAKYIDEAWEKFLQDHTDPQ